MKKYLMIGFAAVAFAACSNHDFETYTPEQVVKAEYDAKFIAEFGKPNPSHNWGFGATTTRAAELAFTRAYTTKGGDVYDQFNFPTDADISAAFPTAVPDGATQIPTEQVQEQAGMSNGGWNFYYGKVGANFVINTAGDYAIGAGWQNVSWISDSSYPNGGYNGVQLYNVYVDVDGAVTISRCGNANFNLYIIRGNVTLASDFGEMGGTISVADGAILNDNRTSLACNYGTSLFNRGTVNTGAYDIGNNARVYNEGKFTATGALSYSAGAGNASYFINFGTGELEAPSMTMNSECHFYTGGKVTIDGLTKVTQSGITWINEGHYTTGTMEFGAGNTTFYNYCQLKVNGNCKFRDGVFNMMNGSYAEFGTIQVNNFHVNLYNNSGFNVLNGGKFGRNGAGLYQGFFAVDGATAYIRLGGDVYIPLHKDYSFQVTGANLVLAYSSGLKFYNNMTIANGSNDICSEEYANVTYSGETNEDGQEMYRWKLNDVTKIVTGSDFSQVTVTPATYPNCGATWNVPGKDPDPKYDGRIMAEDLTPNESSDWDFNDVVFDYAIKDNKAYILLQAAGGTLPLNVGGTLNSDGEVVGGYEVHAAFGLTNTTTMVNTGAGATHAPVALTPLDNKTYTSNADIQIFVKKKVNGVEQWMEIPGVVGEPAGKFVTDITTDWVDEFANIKYAWGNFTSWVQNGNGKFVGAEKKAVYFDRTTRNEPAPATAE